METLVLGRCQLDSVGRVGVLREANERPLVDTPIAHATAPASLMFTSGNQPNAYAAVRNLVIGAFRRAGFASIAHARR